MQLNREKLADVLGCSLRTVDEYRRQGMPGEAPKRAGDQWRFDSGVCIDWLRSRERESVLGDLAQVDEAEARRRKLAAEAAMSEHNLAVAQGKACSIADAERVWTSMSGAMRAKLLGVPSKLAPSIRLSESDAEVEALIDGAIREALQELSETEPELQVQPGGDSEPQGGDAEDLQNPGPAARPDGKRVGGRRAAAERGK